MKTSISVIIPTHRRPRYLRRAILSVLSQTQPADEVVIVENGESSEGFPVVRELQRDAPYLRYMHHPIPSVSEARNVGLKSATGEAIALLDDDDEWLPDKLARQVQILEECPAVGLVTCHAWLIHGEGAEKRVERAPHFEGPLSFKRLIAEGNCIWSPSSVLIRKKCLDVAGLFNPCFDYAEDYEWYLRIARAFPIGRAEEPLIRYHIHSGNISSREPRMWATTIDVLKAQRPSPNLGVTQELINTTIKKYAQRLHHCAVDAMDAGNYQKALGCYLLSVRHDPLVGLKNSWGRFRHPFYRILRPYLAAGYCSWRSLAGRMETAQHA